MKKYYLRPVCQTLALLIAGLVLGGLITANAQNPVIFPTNAYYLGKNYPTNTVPPYNGGGGVPAGALISTPVQTSSNWSIGWYGMKGWSTVQGSTDLVNWVNLNNVEATNFSWTTTISNSLGGSANFRLVQNNSYVGQSGCSGCHADKYNGWANTPHSYAITALLNPDGSFTSSHASSSCLQCHTVGDGQPTGYTYTSNSASYTSPLANVGCEVCHGPAGWHRSSEKDLITPAVSLDPAICGSCHGISQHPTFQEYTNLSYTIYYSTNKFSSITTNVGPPVTYTTNYTTSIVSGTATNVPMGLLVTGASHFKSAGSAGLGCSPCHAGNNRTAMVKEYYDRLAGNPHPVTLFTSVDAQAFGGAACAVCHDPHGSNYVAQLRYPITSTNFYCVPTVTDPTVVFTTNSSGTITTNSTSSVAYNTAFDSFFNPKIQVCGQCHSLRSVRWDGSTYSMLTNSVVTNIVTFGGYVPVTTYVTNVQVFTNISYTYVYNYITPSNSLVVTNITYSTNKFMNPYATNQVWMASVTNSVTNSTLTVGSYYPLTPYATNGGVVSYTTNSSESKPHYPVQYNVLIGQADFDLAARGGPPNVLTDAHTLSPNQCADCHVPAPYKNGSTNVTGHTFLCDYNSPGCLASACHANYTNNAAKFAADTLTYKMGVSNSMNGVVSLLRQWGTNVAPAILATNFGPLAWEYPSINSYFSVKSTNFVAGANRIFSAGPYQKWNGAGVQPSGTNDNLQLNYVPQDIRMIRFCLNVLYEDQSYGVHNPTYTSNLLSWAVNDLVADFNTAGYWATFTAGPLQGSLAANGGLLSVSFVNSYTSGANYSWTFGDGGTASGQNPTHNYTAPGFYPVNCTVDGKSFTQFILVQP